ncbi:MAG: adenosine kinase [Alphaproteobacteria bacterium]|nr:adenosine kinase [Alphaproteobacteria bacterium]
MATATLDVVGIGNAIVDVITHADDAFLKAHGLAKGAMTLIDAARADALYAVMAPGVEISGGSAGNTMAGIASLGGAGAYIGKVRNDQLGQVFRHDITAAGVRFTTAPATAGPATARCLILVTPDAQRTMNTFLGACVDLGPGDIDQELIEAAQVTYLEGYLFDPPHAKEAFRKAAKIAHAAHRRVALSLSDAFCVDRHRAEFRALLADHIDIVFANEVELLSMFQTQDFEAAVAEIRKLCDVAAVTRSEKGSVVVSREHTHVIDAVKVPRLVDTTGAGDLYASGFLFGLTHGRDLTTCGRLGSLCAGEVIGHFGARPETPLAELAAKAKLL